MKVTRRSLVDKMVKGSVLTLAFSLGGTQVLLTPAQARANRTPLLKLTASQAAGLGALAETMVPGAEEKGVVEFIDHQLNEHPDEAMLIAKYFQVRPPYLGFYATGLEVASSMAEELHGEAKLDALSAEEKTQLVQQMSVPERVVGGFPIFLFYLCLRSDAVDVVYGTPEGFRTLNIPFMQHILPPEGWHA